MKKITIIPLIIILLLAFSSYIYAQDSSIDMNLTYQNAQNTSNVSDNNVTNDTNATGNTNSNASTNTTTVTNNITPPVTSTSSNSDQGLFSASNILSIILITIGIVLILLGVAIFIRTR